MCSASQTVVKLTQIFSLPQCHFKLVPHIAPYHKEHKTCKTQTKNPQIPVLISAKSSKQKFVRKQPPSWIRVSLPKKTNKKSQTSTLFSVYSEYCLKLSNFWHFLVESESARFRDLHFAVVKCVLVMNESLASCEAHWLSVCGIVAYTAYTGNNLAGNASCPVWTRQFIAAYFWWY